MRDSLGGGLMHSVSKSAACAVVFLFLTKVIGRGRKPEEQRTVVDLGTGF